jgi:hypothetical protein
MALVLLLLACSASDGDPSSPDPPAPEAGDPYELNEEWLDSCRSMCGVAEVLARECGTEDSKGRVVSRGVLLGSVPLPEKPPKSYDVACINECLTVRPSTTRCWQQLAESNECLANDALFVCDGDGGADVYGCYAAGSDPALCAQPD